MKRTSFFLAALGFLVANALLLARPSEAAGRTFWACANSGEYTFCLDNLDSDCFTDPICEPRPEE